MLFVYYKRVHHDNILCHEKKKKKKSYDILKGYKNVENILF